MKDIVWSNTLSVEFDEIDDDHRKLVNLFNLLNQAVAAGDAVEYIDALFEELINCTVWHFSHEERLMLKYGYEGLAEHKEEHRELIDSAKQLQRKLEQEGRQLSNSDVEFLDQWLTEHILVTDMKLGPYLAQAV